MQLVEQSRERKFPSSCCRSCFCELSEVEIGQLGVLLMTILDSSHINQIVWTGYTNTTLTRAKYTRVIGLPLIYCSLYIPRWTVLGKTRCLLRRDCRESIFHF